MDAPPFDIVDLPGAELFEAALAGPPPTLPTISSCLLAIARPRLSRVGLCPAECSSDLREPELALYRLLQAEGGDAFSRYNSLLRRLVSFEHAVERKAREQAAKR